MGTGTFYPEKKTKFFSGLKVPVPIVAPITTTVTPIIVIVQLPKVTGCLHKRIIYSHSVLVTF